MIENGIDFLQGHKIMKFCVSFFSVRKYNIKTEIGPLKVTKQKLTGLLQGDTDEH